MIRGLGKRHRKEEKANVEVSLEKQNELGTTVENCLIQLQNSGRQCRICASELTQLRVKRAVCLLTNSSQILAEEPFPELRVNILAFLACPSGGLSRWQ